MRRLLISITIVACLILMAMLSGCLSEEPAEPEFYEGWVIAVECNDEQFGSCHETIVYLQDKLGADSNVEKVRLNGRWEFFVGGHYLLEVDDGKLISIRGT